jgi:cell filamentation protein
MSYDAEQDPLCYPSSDVLINKASLRDQAVLDDFEFAMVLARGAEPLPDGDLNYAHYRSIHHHLFQDVYDWAGQPRTVRIAKGGNWFCYPENLDVHMARTFQWLADQNFLSGESKSSFAADSAYFLSELNAGHPFREGNGRTQLVFFRLLCANAGLPFNDDQLDPDRTLNAMIASFSGNLGPLTSLIADIIA